MRKIVVGILSLIVVIYLLLMGCSENPDHLIDNFIGPDATGTLKDTVLFAINDTTYFTKTQLNNSLSTKLLIGKGFGLTARPILKFATLPENATYQSAKIRFISSGILEDEPPVAFTIQAFPVLEDWISNADSVWTDYTQNFDATLPVSNDITITTAPGDTMFLELNQDGLDKFSFWADTENAAENAGIILDFDDGTANFLKYFISRSSETNPALISIYTVPDDTTVYLDTLLATHDGFVYQMDQAGIPSFPGLNFVSTLHVYNILLEFDLENFSNQLPVNSSITSATLQMYPDLGISIFDENFAANLEITKLKSEIDNSSVVIDSNITQTLNFNDWAEDSSYISTTSGLSQQNLGKIVQLLVQDTSSVNGLLIRFKNEINFYSYLAFYRRGDINRAPRLKLTYWLPRKGRF